LSDEYVACPAGTKPGLSPAQPTKHLKPLTTLVEEQPRPTLVHQTTVSSTTFLCTVIVHLDNVNSYCLKHVN